MPAIIYKNVGWLDVSMNNSFPVRGIQRIRNLNAERNHGLKLHGTVRYPVFQRHAVNSQHTFQRSSAHFTGIVRSRIYRKESRNCARQVTEHSGGRVVRLG